MNWISVKDDLPEKYEVVIVTNGKVVCVHFKQSGFNFEGGEGDDLYDVYCRDSYSKHWCGIDEGEITHWMRIPEVPKELK